MNANEVKLLEVIEAELRAQPGEITLETPLVDLGDSLDLVEVLGAVEDAFDVRIDDGRNEHVRTVRDLLRYIETPAPAC